MNFNFTIKVPIFLARIILEIYLLYKKILTGKKYKYIILPKGFVIVDESDYEKLNQNKWSVKIAPAYAVRKEKGEIIYMHNEIMQPGPGFVVDHKDHNTLNNSRENLRLATKSQNISNRRKKQG